MHLLPVARGVIVVAAEVKRPVDDVEEHLALEREAALAGLAERGVRGHDHLAEEVVLVVVEREAHDVGRTLDREVVDVDLGDRLVVHEGDREAVVHPALGVEDEAREGRDLPGVRLEATLLVRDRDVGHAGASLTAATDGS